MAKYIKWFDYFWPEKLRNDIQILRRLNQIENFRSIELLQEIVSVPSPQRRFSLCLFPYDSGWIISEREDSYAVRFEHNIGMPHGFSVLVKLYKRDEDIRWRFFKA